MHRSCFAHFSRLIAFGILALSLNSPLDSCATASPADSVFIVSSTLNHFLGSAFLIADDLLMTNIHVVTDLGKCENLEFTDSRGETLSCTETVYCSKIGGDYCILRLAKKTNLPPLPFHFSQNLREGLDSEPLTLIGANRERKLETKVSSRSEWRNGLLLHCLNTVDGNSGAPILNSMGEVLGIHYQLIASHELNCPGKSQSTGIANSTYEILKDLLENQGDLYWRLVEISLQH